VGDPTVRNTQCKACPWRKSTKPAKDIPGGYCARKHVGLAGTIAAPGVLSAEPLRVMACHESPVGREQPCAGWVIHQLGPGNNIALRILARDGRFARVRVDGPQHERLEDTLPKPASRRTARRGASR
jgi:Family of unknown function (DUF6283)